LTGTGTGRVCAWPVFELFAPDQGAADEQGFVCYELAKDSDEGIRALFIRGKRYVIDFYCCFVPLVMRLTLSLPYHQNRGARGRPACQNLE
jgi:hypothetical protein